MGLLKQFVKQDDRLPNLFVGRLNQDQLLDAFRKGITPQQVVRFLEDHAHPKVWKKIPVNVEDQIYLWYRERELVVSDNVDVYTDFVDVEEYNAWAEFADKNEILKGQYVDNKKDEKKLLVEDETYPMMKEFSNKRKELQRAGVQTTNDDENANNDDSYMVVDDAEYDEDDD